MSKELAYYDLLGRLTKAMEDIDEFWDMIGGWGLGKSKVNDMQDIIYKHIPELIDDERKKIMKIDKLERLIEILLNQKEQWEILSNQAANNGCESLAQIYLVRADMCCRFITDTQNLLHED